MKKIGGMSRRLIATAWALEARGITPAAWKILMILSHHVNNKRGDFDVWPSQRELAEVCDMPITTLKRHLKELEEKQFLFRSQRYRENGALSSCTYSLNVKAEMRLPAGSVSHDFEEEDHDDQDDLPIGQSGLGASPTHGLGASPTGGLCSEPLKKEPLKKEDSTPPAKAGEPLRLFGESELPDEKVLLADFVYSRWKEIKAIAPGIAEIRKIDDGLAHTMAVRGKQHARAGETAIDVWGEALNNIASSRFLRGLVPPGPGRESAFKLTIAWATNATHFRDIIGGKYNNDRDPALVDTDGRRIGPTEQAVRGAFARFQSGNQRGGEGGNNLRRLN